MLLDVMLLDAARKLILEGFAGGACPKPSKSFGLESIVGTLRSHEGSYADENENAKNVDCHIW